MNNKRHTSQNALELLETADFLETGEKAAAFCDELHPNNIRTYKIERNINYTNVCVSRCRFCAFCRDAADSEAYTLDWSTISQKIAQTVELGGEQILLQGGFNPELPFSWYEDLLKQIKLEFPNINVHGFSPTEIVFFSKQFSMPVEKVLERLKAAGLGSLPGGGAEILCDEIRAVVSPNKANTEEWLSVCRIWHKMGGVGSATMMFGYIETHKQRVEHLERIRNLQDETGGFTAFIPWTYQPKKVGAWEYLKTLAVSRLYLDNIPNIQSSWVTQGLDIGSLGLRFGANDLGSVMIEENVVAAAGTAYKTNEAELRRRIESFGFIANRRNFI